jgi:hypothetical protein
MPRSYRGSSYPSFSWRCLLGARGFTWRSCLAVSSKGHLRGWPHLPGRSFTNVTSQAPLRWRTIAAIRRTRPVPVGRFSASWRGRCLVVRPCPRTVHYSCSPGPLHLDRPFILPPRRGGVPSGQSWLHGGTVITRPGAVLHLPWVPAVLPSSRCGDAADRPSPAACFGSPCPVV